MGFVVTHNFFGIAPGGWGQRMDSTTIFKERVRDAVCERRTRELSDYTREFLAETISDGALIAGILRLKAEEKARLLKEDEAAMRAALEEKTAEGAVRAEM